MSYQGWTNWDTWNAHLWLTNDEPAYRAMLAIVQDKSLSRTDLEQALIDLISNFLGNPDGIEYSKIDFDELIDALRECS